MPDGPLNRAIRRTLLRLQGEGELTDGQLLERFAVENDEAAFEALVRRHGPMVLRVCRRVLGNSHDAEEAFQATFIVLARKAGAIGRRELVGGWLHGVASRVAMKARAQALQRREQPTETIAEVAQSEETDPGWKDLRPVLDEELGRLPDKYRAPMVLCYLEGKTNSEAADQLGMGRWTIATRLSRGRAMLRERLSRRGVALSALVLTALLEQEAIAAGTAAPAIVVLNFSTAAAGAPVTALAQAAIDGLFWTKVKTWALVAAAVLLVSGVGIGTTLALTGPAQPQAEEIVDPHQVKLGVNANLGGKRPFPDDNPWNTEIADAPVDPNSAALIANIGLDKPLRPHFGATSHGAPHGVPYVVVGGDQPRMPVKFEQPAESDVGPYPIPTDAPIEAGPVGDPNRRLIVLDRDNWKLYELLAPVPDNGGWKAHVGAVFDLNSNVLRPWGFTSADGAGLPIFPGLVRYDEVERQEIRHALRFTARVTRRAFVEPARHYASKVKDPNVPPMGMRVRLRRDFDVSSYPPSAQVILTALQKYGMFLAAHGQEWALSGVPDPRWSDADLKTLESVLGKDFEVVKMEKIESGEMPPRKK